MRASPAKRGIDNAKPTAARGPLPVAHRDRTADRGAGAPLWPTAALCAAVAGLVVLRAEYAARFDALPEVLRDGTTISCAGPAPTKPSRRELVHRRVDELLPELGIVAKCILDLSAIVSCGYPPPLGRMLLQ